MAGRENKGGGAGMVRLKCKSASHTLLRSCTQRTTTTQVCRHGFPGSHALLGEPCGDPCVGAVADAHDSEQAGQSAPVTINPSRGASRLFQRLVWDQRLGVVRGWNRADARHQHGKLWAGPSEAIRRVLQVQPAVPRHRRLHGRGASLDLDHVRRRRRRRAARGGALPHRPDDGRAEPGVLQPSDDHHDDGAAAGLSGVRCGPHVGRSTGPEALQKIRHVPWDHQPAEPGSPGLWLRPPLRAGGAAELVVCFSADSLSSFHWLYESVLNVGVCNARVVVSNPSRFLGGGFLCGGWPRAGGPS